MADLGTDISAVFDIDPSLTMVSGRYALAEAVARRWITVPGGLFYDPTYGAGLLTFLHGAVQSPETIGTMLENEALKDERVATCNAEVTFEGDELRVVARIADDIGPFRFVLNVSALSVELLLENS